MKIRPVILCGGSGTRLWPFSREQYPKQLLKLFDETTMLQSTVLRLKDIKLVSDNVLASPILVANEDYRFLVAQQMREIDQKDSALIIEPHARNTAPAVTLAALEAIKERDDSVIIVMPSDHVIQDTEVFQQAVIKAVMLAKEGNLVTFGIVPTSPETGYGYIQTGNHITGEDAFVVARFVEKPDLIKAEEYLASGNYLWNSGIYVMKASVWLDKINQFHPDIYSAAKQAFENRVEDLDFVRPEANAFFSSPSNSIDYAVMEKLADGSKNNSEIAVIPLDAGWSDVGAWNSLWEILEKDSKGNVMLGDTVSVDTYNSFVCSQSRMVACLGLNDVVIAETPDAVLVADKNKVQDIREIVALLKKSHRQEIDTHRKVYRPWGWYDSIDYGLRFKVKRIVVNPGAAISLQMHYHRAEHWVVVSGTAKITREDEIYIVSENESTFIPLGIKHRLENPGQIPLEIVEVQSGGYLGEDDIVRFEDLYGRK